QSLVKASLEEGAFTPPRSGVAWGVSLAMSRTFCRTASALVSTLKLVAVTILQSVAERSRKDGDGCLVVHLATVTGGRSCLRRSLLTRKNKYSRLPFSREASTSRTGHAAKWISFAFSPLSVSRTLTVTLRHSFS